MKTGAAALLAVLALVITAPAMRAEAQQSNALGLAGDDNNNKPVNIEAENGIEWQQSNKVYIARGNAKATRGDDTVNADTLYAYYRDAQQSQRAASATPQLRGNSSSNQQSPLDSSSTQVYRIVAEGHVVFTTPSQTAYGDRGDYNVDQAMLVVTGKALKIVTQQDIITARDSFEWYDQKQIGVARGDAVAIRQGPEKKSIRGDVLTAEVSKPANQPSKISKVNAQGHVVLVSGDQIARGDTGVYNLDTGIATMNGHVSLTRGENELRGQYAVVDTNTNVARLLAAPPTAQTTGPRPRVEGLLIPRQGQPDTAMPGTPTPGTTTPAQPSPAPAQRSTAQPGAR